MISNGSTKSINYDFILMHASTFLSLFISTININRTVCLGYMYLHMLKCRRKHETKFMKPCSETAKLTYSLTALHELVRYRRCIRVGFLLLVYIRNVLLGLTWLTVLEPDTKILIRCRNCMSKQNNEEF